MLYFMNWFETRKSEPELRMRNNRSWIKKQTAKVIRMRVIVPFAERNSFVTKNSIPNRDIFISHGQPRRWSGTFEVSSFTSLFIDNYRCEIKPKAKKQHDRKRWLGGTALGKSTHLQVEFERRGQTRGAYSVAPTVMYVCEIKNRSSLLSKLVRKWPFFCRRCNLSRCFTNNGCPLRTRYIRTFIEELSRLINMGMLISQRCAFYDLVTFFY